ncbi:ATP-grasp domain-containing protein [Planococcus sp. YIM B11945]|uniref:ATP-grasp domain-containing protein n=1 Tax=Planococcus sp. YIM B11945 TaxID=3435410 RepID=UPI003D7EC6F0
MNLLILCAGRRVKIVQYFNRELEKSDGLVFSTDMDICAPAIYFSSKFFHVSKIDEENYVDDILQICIEQKVDALLSLIDPELGLIASNRERFEAHGIYPILSPLPMVEMSFDKFAMHQFLIEHGLPSVPTYDNLTKVESAIGKGEIAYPLIAKPANGSASLGIQSIEDEASFSHFRESPLRMVYQPFFKDKEYGVDVYVDLLTGDLVDLFIKEKLCMRAGETDKSRSVHNREIEQLVSSLIAKTDFRGPIDIDVFERNGQFYISEVNPRFGGGYPHAYECGVNFPRYIINNLNGIANPPYGGFAYKEGKIMMKYDDVILI